MLLNCPECELQISDKALTCPHCGYPLKSDTVKKQRKSNRRKRLPNGFGQITEIKGKNLRDPFRAMVTVGKDSKGKPICKLLKPEAYFPTYNDAYAALVEYNKNPYDLESDVTVLQLYEKWSAEYFKNITESSQRTVTSAWIYCSAIYDMRAVDVRARHMKGCMEEGYRIETRGKKKGEKVFASAETKSRMKSLFNLMFDYALEYEIVDRNYARTFNLSDDIVEEKEEVKRAHIPFTDKEMELLWNNVDTVQYVDVVVIQCYSGWRPQELGLIELENVNLEEWYFIGGMKTAAGKDRQVPIHPKIRDLVKRKYDEAVELGSKYLFNCTDTHTHRSNLMFTYDKYQKRFAKIVKQLNLHEDHRPHDPRVHFITMAKECKLDEYAVKYIAGHAIDDITEKTYTHRKFSWLVEEMQKIK